MMETPCVVVNVQRGGPSTGLPTMVGQADMMQARWGSHGDYEIIALSPQSPQEAFDLTIEAFNLAERYRVPVLCMLDECVGHMTEKVVIPEPTRSRSCRGARQAARGVPALRDQRPDGPRDVAAGATGYRFHTPA
jgi:2-oxoglutarate ferredoxin oxidoreductase subunit alpha